MKEQILHLDPHDDFNSARDKMGWVQTERVLLVWPARGRVLARHLDLLLLHRHAHRLGAHLGLVTHDREVREHARILGLPVFDTVEGSRRMRWRSRLPRLRPTRRRPPPDPQAFRRAPPPVKTPDFLRRATHFAAKTLDLGTEAQVTTWAAQAVRGLFFAMGVGALAFLAYALIPSATITLTPATRPISASLEVVADADLNQVFAPNLIPARTVRVEVADEGLANATGARDVPGERAGGTVVFTNLLGIPATIPQGTGVRTTSSTPIRFTTLKAASMEGRIGAAVQVDIQALDAGPTGNVAAGQINAIDGPLGLQLAVTNPTPTSGGAVIRKPAVTDYDRQNVREQLMAALQQKALGQLEAGLQPGEFLAPDSLKVAQVLAETYDHASGETADTVKLTLRLAVTGLVVNEKDARLVAQAALIEQVAPGEELAPVEMRFERDPTTRMDADGHVRFNVTASGAAVPLIDRDLVRQLVRGRSVPQAASVLLTALPLATLPHIDVEPQWYRRLPWMLFRIEVKLQGSG